MPNISDLRPRVRFMRILNIRCAQCSSPPGGSPEALAVRGFEFWGGIWP